MRETSIKEWTVRMVQFMYKNSVRVNDTFVLAYINSSSSALIFTRGFYA